MTKPIERITFELLTAEEVRAMSVMEVEVEAIWGDDGPAKGGLLDARMGAVTRDLPCKTCGGCMVSPVVTTYALARGGGSGAECPGHFGHMELPVPVFTPTTIEVAHKIMGSFCVFCGDCLLAEEKRAAVCALMRRADSDEARVAILFNATGGGVKTGKRWCRGCHQAQPVFKMHRGRERQDRVDGPRWFPLTAEWTKLLPDGASLPEELLGVTLPVTAMQAEAALGKCKLPDLVAETGFCGGDPAKAHGFLGSLTLRALPVMPPCARPSNVAPAENGSKFPGARRKPKVTLHALTQKLLHIFKAKRRLAGSMEMGSTLGHVDSFGATRVGMWNLYDGYAALQFYVDWLMDVRRARVAPDSVPRTALAQTSMATFSVATNLNGKTGRVRWNVVGKRVNFSVRTVISPDPNVPFDCVAIPAEAAALLTIPETVTPLNREELQREASVYQKSHGSTRSIFSADGKTQRDLGRKPYDPRSEGPLEVGQIVERRLRDGDIVLLNRQPSLHGPSMQAMYVVIQNRRSIGFGLAKCPPFNADFDGDEMNLHVPQSLQARAEAEQLMRTPQLLLLPAKNAPCMGMNQDSLLSLHVMSRRDQFFGRVDAMEFLFHVSAAGPRGASESLISFQLPAPAILKPEPLWTGKQLISLALPSSVSKLWGSLPPDGPELASTKDETVLIHQGVVLMGRLAKKHVGVSAGSVFHVVAAHHGYAGKEAERDRAISACFDGLEAVSRQFLMIRGFSVGLQDAGLFCERGPVPCRPEDPRKCRVCRHEKKIVDDVENLRERVATRVREQRYTKATPAERLVHEEVRIDAQTTALERWIVAQQDNLKDALGVMTQKIVRERNVGRPNAILTMMDAGSKGNPNTFTQTAVMVGGQVIKGSRVVDVDNGAEYAPPPIEMTLEGLPSRTVFSRMLVWPWHRGLPHYLRGYPGACEGGFVQQSFFLGLDAPAFWFHDAASRQGLIDTAQNVSKSGYLQRRMVYGMMDLMMAYDNTVRNASGRIVQFSFGADPKFVQAKPFGPSLWETAELRRQFTWSIPWDPHDADEAVLYREEREIWNSLETLRSLIVLRGGDRGGLVYTVGRIRDLLGDLAGPAQKLRALSASYIDETVRPNEDAKSVAELTEAFFARVVVPDEIHRHEARVWLSSRQLLAVWKLDESAVREALVRIERGFREGMPEPGCCVGSIAAMSLGEPATQMTLNSFHAAGSSAAKIGGVDRCRELVEATKDDKTPLVRTYLSPRLRQKIRNDVSSADFKEALVRATLPIQAALRTTLLGALVRETCIDYFPLVLMRGAGDRLFLGPRGGPEDEVHRAEFDACAWEGEGSQEEIRRANMRLEHSLDDECDPPCAGTGCAWRDKLGVRCMSGFLMTLWMDADWFGATEIAPEEVADALKRGPLINAYEVHVGQVERGLIPLRVRARLCRVYKVHASNDAAAIEKIPQVEDLEALAQGLRSVRVYGPPNTARVTLEILSPLRFNEAGKVESGDWDVAIDVATRDLQYVLSLSGDRIDATRTTASSVHEVARVMGIEAARSVLLREFEEMAASGSVYVDRHHMALVADTMTSTGSYVGFAYEGQLALRDDVLMHAAYEQQAATFANAGVNRSAARINSPAAALFVGRQVPRMGTGAFSVILDPSHLDEAIPVVDEVVRVEKRRRPVPLSPEKTVVFSPVRDFGPASPACFSPISDSRFVSFVEISRAAAAETERTLAARGGSTLSSLYSPSSFATSPSYSPSSPFLTSPTSPICSPSYSPTSPFAVSPGYSPTSPFIAAAKSPTSPGYSPTSPGYSPTSPGYSPTSPGHSPSSPGYSPTLVEKGQPAGSEELVAEEEVSGAEPLRREEAGDYEVAFRSKYNEEEAAPQEAGSDDEWFDGGLGLDDDDE